MFLSFPHRRIEKIFIPVLFVVFALTPYALLAETTGNTITIDARSLLKHSNITISPASGAFLEGSNFEIPIFINTEGNSVNTIDLRVKFDASKLSIVKPSGDKSIIAVWLEPPSYNNTKGTAKLVGVIPNGIVTDSGLIATISFKAIAIGQAVVSISQDTRVLLNDGQGTETSTQFGRGTYSILPKPPEGVRVYSDTHSFQDHWYNNPNPILFWEKEPGVTDFSYTLDNKPFTVPDNNPITKDTIKAYENLDDGLWYFHIKALKQKVWGAPTHFLVRVDTAPPAEFIPTLDYLTATVINRAMVSFFTTDNISGIDHYEVGVIDKTKAPTESPVFIQTESPYQLPLTVSRDLRVIVRAFDKAGNVRDESVDVHVPFLFMKFITDNLIWILLGILLFILLLIIIHYLFGHHIVRRFRRAVQIVEKEDEQNEISHAGPEHSEQVQNPPGPLP